jgi:phosphate transport system substrate-binding protein
MKRYLVVLMAACSMTMPMRAGSFKIAGSSTMVALTKALAGAYMSQHPDVKIIIDSTNTGIGIADLIAGKAEVAASTRPLKGSERTKIPDSETILVARDGIAVLVHPSNALKSLTVEQVEGIYTGRITNWKEVGGPDAPVNVYRREEGTAKQELFQSVVLQGKPFTPRAKICDHAEGLLETLARDPHGIGFGATVHPPSVKVIALVTAASPFAQQPTPAALSNGAYPLVQNMYYVVRKSAPAEVRSFLDFAASPAGQAVTAKAGFVPR